MAFSIVDHPSQHSVSRNGMGVVAIIMHGTVGTNSLAYLTQNDRQVSTHYLIPKSGNPIYRMVSEDRGANHAGFGRMPRQFPQVNPNLVTIGIELENLQDGKDPYPDTQLLAMGWLINDIRKRRGNLPIYRHADIDPARRKDTVGLSVPEMEEWARRAALLGAATPAASVYTFPGLPIYQSSMLIGSVALYLPKDTYLEIDQIGGPGYAPTAGHVKRAVIDGRDVLQPGFVDTRQLRSV